MAEDQIPLNFYAHLRQEPDQSFTIVVEISGIPSVETADRVSKWMQTDPAKCGYARRRRNSAEPALTDQELMQRAA
jgi:hypothetical protein